MDNFAPQMRMDEVEKLINVLAEPSNTEEFFQLADAQNRRLLLCDEIDQFTIKDMVRHIMRYNREDKGKEPSARQPVIIYIVSPGGDCFAGFELIDIIEASKTPVYTVNIGYMYSMALPIGISGHKRYALKNATYLIHDGTSEIMNSGGKAQDTAEFVKKINSLCRDYIVAKTKITAEEYASKERYEWYFFADEAKERGVVDYIVGVDCDIDEIL